MTIPFNPHKPTNVNQNKHLKNTRAGNTRLDIHEKYQTITDRNRLISIYLNSLKLF